ncbi:MAG: DUF3999 family protein, partial [Desulfoprunum sp.]|nr:DUF3999 family protein [Desulfoprunum sp.]
MKKNLLTLLVFLLGVGPVSAGELSPGDFAYGYPLKTDSKGAISALVVPDEVYRTARRADLGDLRVFNAAGEIVPHLLRQAALQDVSLPSREDVPFFPLPQTAGQGAGAELAVMVQRNVHGTIIHIDSQQSVPGTGKPVSAYLFDLSGLKIEARDLELIWPTGGLAVATVDLQESSDLVQWRPLVESATLVDLQHQGQRIAQRTIHLPAQPLKYVKMTDQTGQGLFALQKVTVLSGIEPARQQRHWLALDKGKVSQEDTLTAVDFASSYRLPVSGARLLFPEPNSMLRATVQSRPDDKSPWLSRCSGV